MRTKIIRGQSIGLNGENIYIHINRALDGKFSLSDKIVSMVSKGKTAIVSFGGTRHKEIITKKTPVLFHQSVQSKFENGRDWLLYWYRVKEEPKGQLCLW